MSTREIEIDLQACRENLLRREQKRYQENEALRNSARMKILKAVQTVAVTFPEIKRIHLFGSVTRPGAFHRLSDVDVAVEGVDGLQYFNLWHSLGNAAPDLLIDLRQIDQPSYFAESVRERGELVYERQDAG